MPNDTSDARSAGPARGTLMTVSAPSGAGKTSLVRALVEADSSLLVSVSHTTRGQRSGEIDGSNYHFVDTERFAAMVAEQAFLEHAEVFGNHYGTSKQWVMQQLAAGSDVILEIDWQGARQVKAWAESAGQFYLGIFILPPSLETLRERLDDRGQDDRAVIDARMQQAVDEISHFNDADYLVVNDDFQQATAELLAIVQSSRLAGRAQAIRHSALLESLLAKP